MAEQNDKVIEIMMTVHKDIGNLQGSVAGLHRRFDTFEENCHQLEKDVKKNTSYRNAVKVIIAAVGVLAGWVGISFREILLKINLIQGK